jgi:BAAT / Acyl-CoA thioester hydrolase C terminal
MQHSQPCILIVEDDVDLLSARPEVDEQRLGYIGWSYGAAIGGLLAAVERRIKAYVLAVGGGGCGRTLYRYWRWFGCVSLSIGEATTGLAGGDGAARAAPLRRAGLASCLVVSGSTARSGGAYRRSDSISASRQ